MTTSVNIVKSKAENEGAPHSESQIELMQKHSENSKDHFSPSVNATQNVLYTDRMVNTESFQQDDVQRKEEAELKFMELLERARGSSSDRDRGHRGKRLSDLDKSSENARQYPGAPKPQIPDLTTADKKISDIQSNSESFLFTEEPSGLGLGTSFEGIGDTSRPGIPPPHEKIVKDGEASGFLIGGMNRLETKSRPPADRQFGKWEKHTKGIGMKLLSKMGFQAGDGLGSKRRKADAASAATNSGGASRPVEVIVRPSNLGLGYGNFQEASSLKVNKQIDAEIERTTNASLGKKNANIRSERRFDGLQPSTEKSDWISKRPSKKQKRKSQQVSEAANAQAKGTNVIQTFEMEHSGASSVVDDGVPLGQELLYNLNLVIGTTKADTHSCKSKVSSTQNKVASIERDVADLQERLNTVRKKEEKLKVILRSIEEIEEFTNRRMKESSVSPEQDVGSTIEDVIRMLRDLKEKYEAEYISLRLSKLSILLLSPVISNFFAGWNPLVEPDKIATVVGQWKHLFPIDQQAETTSSIIDIHLLPKIQRVILIEWNVKNAQPCVRLYQILSMALSIGEPTSYDAHLESELGPSESKIPSALLDNVIFPKIHRAVSKWKPRKDDFPLHEWIFPWLPYFKNDAVSSLLSDIARKLRNAFLSTGRNAWHPSDDSAINMLKPWKGVMDSQTLDDLVADAIIPQLATSLSELKIDPSQQELAPIQWVLHWYEAGLLPMHYMESIFEGEFFLNWATTLHAWVSSGVANFEEVAQFYLGWKSMVPAQLLNDLVICCHLYAGLSMIDAAISNDTSALDDLRPPDRHSLNYLVVYRRRVAESGKTETSTDATEKESAQKAASIDPVEDDFGDNMPRIPFRDVVEYFALEQGISFQPRVGNKDTKDGKKVFLFGKIPVYFDSGVAYAMLASKWQPTSLYTLVTANAEM